MRRVALLAVAAVTLAACGDTDSETDPPGGTARASQLTECLKKADLNTEQIDNKEGSSRAFSITKGTSSKPAAYAYVFEDPEKAKAAQSKLFETRDKKTTVSAQTTGDTVLLTTWSAANAQPALGDCFRQAS